jgi:hypothetical protein
MYNRNVNESYHANSNLVKFAVHISWQTKKYVNISFQPFVQEEPYLNCSSSHIYDNPTLRGQEAT